MCGVVSGVLRSADGYLIWPVENVGVEDMCLETKEECVDELLSLRSRGIKVPQRAIDRLLYEIGPTAIGKWDDATQNV